MTFSTFVGMPKGTASKKLGIYYRWSKVDRYQQYVQAGEIMPTFLVFQKEIFLIQFSYKLSSFDRLALSFSHTNRKISDMGNEILYDIIELRLKDFKVNYG